MKVYGGEELRIIKIYSVIRKRKSADKTLYEAYLGILFGPKGTLKNFQRNDEPLGGETAFTRLRTQSSESYTGSQ
jgi:hypothetical protein